MDQIGYLLVLISTHSYQTLLHIRQWKGNVGLKVLEMGKRGRRGEEEETGEEVEVRWTEPRGPEKLQAARDLIAGE